MKEHCYFTRVSLASLSDERKDELIKFLVSSTHDGKVMYSTKHSGIVKSLAKVKHGADENKTTVLETVDSIVYLLAQCVWQSLKDRMCERFYVVDVAQTHVTGYGEKINKEE
jgi:hypothetical protein